MSADIITTKQSKCIPVETIVTQMAILIIKEQVHMEFVKQLV